MSMRVSGCVETKPHGGQPLGHSHQVLLLRLAAFLAAAICFPGLAPFAEAQQAVVTLDPAQTKIEITLGATAHTVHGTFRLKKGEIRFHPDTGEAGGLVVVDAGSGNTENDGRDKKMHKEVLESEKFSEITFTPHRVEGKLAPDSESKMRVTGTLSLHGQDHDVTLDVVVQPSPNGQLNASTQLEIPYVKWGLKNPSNFLLHVATSVNVNVQAIGSLANR
jgi:polyisoprenoid-binding protein YceI